MSKGYENPKLLNILPILVNQLLWVSKTASFGKRYALLDPFGGTNGFSRRIRKILLEVFCLRSCISNFIFSE